MAGTCYRIQCVAEAMARAEFEAVARKHFAGKAEQDAVELLEPVFLTAPCLDGSVWHGKMMHFAWVEC